MIIGCFAFAFISLVMSKSERGCCPKAMPPAEDALEFMLAGATGVAVGAMNFVNPYTTLSPYCLL